MIINVTSIRLRSLWKFFPLSYQALGISVQAKNHKGFIKMKNRGFGYMHYTLTAWESMEDLQAFARSGAHLESLKKSSRLAIEIRTFSYPSEEFPKWSTAQKTLMDKGKIFTFR